MVSGRWLETVSGKQAQLARYVGEEEEGREERDGRREKAWVCLIEGASTGCGRAHDEWCTSAVRENGWVRDARDSVDISFARLNVLVYSISAEMQEAPQLAGCRYVQSVFTNHQR